MVSHVGIIGCHVLTLMPSIDSGVKIFTQVVASVGAMVFCGVYFVHCQRQLLFKELCCSFDFLFMSFQFTTAHLCVGELVGWDGRALGILASWLWSHWIITLDAVTHVMKRKLGYHPRGAIFIDVMLLLEQVSLVVMLFSSAIDVYEDASIATIKMFGHVKQVRVIPFLLWRNFTSFLWCSRLLWRLIDRKEDELIVLQGQLQYDEAITTKPGPRTSKFGARVDTAPIETGSSPSGRATERYWIVSTDSILDRPSPISVQEGIRNASKSAFSYASGIRGSSSDCKQ